MHPVELLPIAAFFIAFKLYGFFIATAVLVGAMIVQLVVMKILKKPISKLQIVVVGIAIVFGSATVWIQDEMILKWKTSIVYWILAFAFLLTPYFTGKTIYEKVLEGKMELPQEAFKAINISWIIFFTCIGAINIYVAYEFDNEFWVNFKVFGTLLFTLIFAFLQLLYIFKKFPEAAKKLETSKGSQGTQK